jgi:hypothetical protein
MAIENRSLAWRMAQSWYVLLTLPFGVLSGFAFLYLAIRARRGKWLLWSAVYFGALIWLLSRPQVTGADGQETITNAVTGGLLVMWLVSLIHALVARREFLTILDQREGGTAEAAYAAAPEAEYAPDPQGDFAIFMQTGRPAISPPPRAVSAPPPVELADTPPPLPREAAAPVAPPPLPPEAAAPPPLPPRAAAPAEPQAPPPPPGPGVPPPFSGPAPFGGRKPFEEDADRPAPPAPPSPPRRPGREVDY